MTRQTLASNCVARLAWKSTRAMLAATAVLLAACPSPPTPPIIPPGPYTPGQSYFGRNNYIEYIAGDGPVILSATHGGDLTPAQIPDRTDAACGAPVTTTADLNTYELVIAMQQAIHARFGVFPHVVINHLHRRKLDANRPISEAACGNSETRVAWLEFHAFMDAAKLAVVNGPGKGWYMDMHGHGHASQRLELGYLLSAVELRQPDSVLDATTTFEDASSINTISKDETDETFSSLLRGLDSLGTLYAANYFPSVPSSSDPFPQSGDPYFNGGFSTERHTCSLASGPLGGQPNGKICGVQIEANRIGVRDTPANRTRFAEVTATILETYLAAHWGIQLGTPVR
jgi:hypothetical protein